VWVPIDLDPSGHLHHFHSRSRVITVAVADHHSVDVAEVNLRARARAGDVLEVLMLGHPIGFKVLEVRPEEGRIGEGTEFLFEGLEPAREMAPRARSKPKPNLLSCIC